MTKDTDKTKEQLINELTALRQKEHQWELFSSATSNLLWNWNFEDDSVERNGHFETMLGYSNEEVLSTITWWTEKLHPEDRDRIMSVFQETLESGKNTCTYNYRFQKQDGSYIEIRDHVFILRDQNGVGTRALGAMTDITQFRQAEEERKQLEAQLRSSQLYYKTVIETATDPIIIIDDQGIIETVNDATTKSFGHTKEALIGQNIKILMPEPYYSQHDDYLENYHLTGKNNIIGTGREVMGLRKDQTTFPLHLSVAKISLDGVIKFTGIIRDISKEKKQEQDLVKLQRLRAVSELSAGISHNLNNMLMTIMGPAQMLQTKTNDPSILEDVDDIMTAAIRARDLVKRLHKSTQSTVFLQSELEPVNIESIIIETVQQTRPRWKDEAESKNITIGVSTQLTSVPFVKAIPSEISDILVNLMFNAIDAMPAGGMITINTEKHEQDVVLTFSDTGIGMDEETKKRIFEPFFTTKLGIGTGLGLSTIYNSINQLDGQIHVESDIGIGTIFHIYLPVWSVPEEKPESQDTKTRHSGNVLILDDDPTVRKALSQMLSIHHTVDVFENGKSALEKLEAKKYDVAVIDLSMPDMSGDQVAHLMRQRDACLAIILISGWHLDQNDPRIATFDYQIQKPIDDVESLFQTIDDAIQLHHSRC